MIKHLFYFKKKMIKKKCPNCGSKNFEILDYYIRPYIYEVENYKVTAAGFGEELKHVKTTCNCKECGYEWHPKKISYTIEE